MTVSRYAWGWYGAKVVALLNCIACVGWSACESTLSPSFFSSSFSTALSDSESHTHLADHSLPILPANTIAGGQLLSSVADENMSSAVGCVIIALVTLVIGFLGYKAVHYYERYSWIPTFITFLIMLGVTAKELYNAPAGMGQAEYSSVFSMGATVFGFGEFAETHIYMYIYYGHARKGR